MATKVRVVKVGGSLLVLADLERRLQEWLVHQSTAHHVLVIGGGQLVNLVREWNSRWQLEDEVAHWMCIELMSATARLFQSRLPELLVTEDVDSLRRRIVEPGCTIFDTGRWHRETEPQLPGTTLPIGWDVTSDSIAARLAVALDAEEFVLLKSVLPEEVAGIGIPALAESGVVDAMLPRLCAELPAVRIVNFRSDPPREVSIPASAPSLETL